MADTRKTKLVRALIGRHPVMAALTGFTPPTVEKIKEENKGGRFVSSEDEVVGVKLGDWTLSLEGVSADLIESMAEGDQAEVTVLESIEGDDGSKIPRKHEMSGQVIKSDLGEIKVGKESGSIMGSPYAYTLTEGGRVIHDINTRTQKCIVGGKDLLAEARRHVGLS